MAKRFFYVCAGLCLLALSYHLGAKSVEAQAGTTGFGFGTYGYGAYVMTPNGDVYFHQVGFAGVPTEGCMDQFSAVRLGNFWGGGATATAGATWGQVKSTYRK